MQRIVVVGSSGSGKTTLAREIAQRLGYPHIELDALHWEPNWREAEGEVFRRRMADAVAKPCWVLDGNYAAVRDLIWARADTVVWLDYPMTVVFSRVLLRTLRRGICRQELWNGNRERLWVQFATRDSLLLWVINSWRRRRRDYPKLLRRPGYVHLLKVRLRSPAEAERWLASIGASPCPRTRAWGGGAESNPLGVS